jgi:hypothetical protein
MPNVFHSFLLVSALAGSQVVNKNEPMFITRSEAFKFAVGDVITLPCQVSHPGKPFLLFPTFYQLALVLALSV